MGRRVMRRRVMGRCFGRWARWCSGSCSSCRAQARGRGRSTARCSRPSRSTRRIRTRRASTAASRSAPTPARPCSRRRRASSALPARCRRTGRRSRFETAEGLAVSLTHLGSIGVARDAHVVEGAVVGAVGPSGAAGVRDALRPPRHPHRVERPGLPRSARLPACRDRACAGEASRRPRCRNCLRPPRLLRPHRRLPHRRLRRPRRRRRRLRLRNRSLVPAAPAAVPAAPVETPAAATAEPVEPGDGLVVTRSRPRFSASQPAASHARPVSEPRSLGARATTPLRHVQLDHAQLVHGRVQVRKALAHPTPSVTQPATGAAASVRAGRKRTGRPLVAPAMPANSRSSDAGGSSRVRTASQLAARDRRAACARGRSGGWPRGRSYDHEPLLRERRSTR